MYRIVVNIVWELPYTWHPVSPVINIYVSMIHWSTINKPMLISLTEFHINCYFFLVFNLTFFFCSKGPSRLPYAFSHISLVSSWPWLWLNFLSCWPWQFDRVLGLYSIACPSNGAWCFSHGETWVVCFGNEVCRCVFCWVPFSSVVPQVRPISKTSLLMLTLIICLRCSVLSTVKLCLSSFCLVCFRRKSPCTAHIKE